MTFTQIAVRLSLLAGFMGFAGTLFAGPIGVPVTGQDGCCFYSIQLRGVSFDANGENVAVTTWDYTDDTSAYGSITITDTDTSATVFSNTYYNACDCYGAGVFTDQALFELAPGNYSVNEYGYEYSQAAVFYGSTIESAGGWWNGGSADFTQSFTVTAATAATPEPASAALIVLGLGAFGVFRRKAAHRA
jgi:hypothetical protein